MGLYPPLNGPLSRRPFTRKALLAWLRRRPAGARLPDLVDEFAGVERVTDLRRQTRDRFPATRDEVYLLKQRAQATYPIRDPCPGYLRMVSLLVRLRDEGEIYITHDQSTILPTAHRKGVMSNETVHL